MYMRVERLPSEVVKTAESGDDRRRLAAEAAVLQACAHPGVVAVRRVERGADLDDVDALVLAAVEGPTLAEVGRQPIELVAGWGASLATVLADLHDLGYAHGAVSPHHVILDGGGRPTLCGFGSARRLGTGKPAMAARTGDLTSLARLLEECLPPEAGDLPRRVNRYLHRRRIHRPATGAGLAALLTDRVGGAYVGPPVDAGAGTGEMDSVVPAPVVRRPHRRPRVGRAHQVRRVVLTGGLAAGALVGAAVCAGSLPSGGTVREDTIPAATGTYRISTPASADALTVIGRWGCGAERPAVLYRSDGSVWVFPSVPLPGESVPGTRVAHVGPARGIVITSGPPGCDQLVVTRATGAQVQVGVPSR
jgi:tRNA A-37 threonylcarbamoyl transferase component Bud32